MILKEKIALVVNQLLTKIGVGDKLKNRLLKGAVSLFGLKVFSAGCGFIISMILARILGSSDYGLYVFVFTILDLLILLGTAGIDTLVVKNIAIYQSNNNWGLINGLLKWSHQFVLGVCAVLIMITLTIIWLLGDQVDKSMEICFWIGILFLPIASIRNINIAALNGLQKFTKAHIGEFLIRPIIFIALIFFVYAITNKNVTAIIISVVHVLVSGICLSIVMILLNQNLPKKIFQEKAQYEIKNWLKTSLPLLFYASLIILYTYIDTLMLGVMTNVALVGIYDAAMKGKLIMYMVNQSVSSVLQPNVASLYAQGKIETMEKMVKKSSRILFMIVFCISISLMIFSKFYLSLFGNDFIVGQIPLIMLCIFTLIDNIAPFNILLLNMTGYERDTVVAIGISSVLNVILNWLWIPQWEIIGVVASTGVSISLLNIYATIMVRRKLKINCTIV